MPKTWGLEKDSEKVKEIRKRELKIKIRGGGGGGVGHVQGTGSPISFKYMFH